MSTDLPDDLEHAGLTGGDIEALSLEPDRLDGHTIDELADYLDAGMMPADPGIDDSPACQNALDALTRVRMLSHTAFDREADGEEERDAAWVTEILTNITLEAHAGRDIPLPPLKRSENSVITEGAVRSIIRRAGDTIDGVLIGRCSLEGDVTTPHAPIRVEVGVTIVHDHGLTDLMDRIRAAVLEALNRHTELNVTGIDVTARNAIPAAVSREGR